LSISSYIFPERILSDVQTYIKLELTTASC
jgi:hypothetical protein